VIRTQDAARRGDELFHRFRTRVGSDYIASGFALGAIIQLVEHRKPQAVLEVGSGIGTITTGVLEARARAGIRAGVQVAVEEIPFCQEQLEANLGEQFDRVVLVARAADLAPDVGPFDLVIIDGGASTDLEPGDRAGWTAADERAEVRAWIGRLAPKAVVLVENERAPQRGHVEAEATRPFVHEHVRPFDASPGFHLYWFDPSPQRRLGVALRERVRRLWFPRGIRLARRGYHRLTGRYLPERETVAIGDGQA